jgi:plastocyanin
MFFSTNSTTGELASLNNTVYVYKDKIDERRGNLTTIAWEWNGGNATNATMMGAGNAANATGATSGANTTATSVSIVPGSSTLTTDAFLPNPIQVAVGTTVTWTNNDAEPHTVTLAKMQRLVGCLTLIFLPHEHLSIPLQRQANIPTSVYSIQTWSEQW